MSVYVSVHYIIVSLMECLWRVTNEEQNILEIMIKIVIELENSNMGKKKERLSSNPPTPIRPLKTPRE